MPENVLVTGATGFTGSHLVASLVADGYRVTVLARNRERAQTLPAEVKVVVGDVTDRAAVRRATAGPQVVYHLAAAFREAGIPDERYREVHVDGTRYLLEAADEEGVRRFVHCSTVGVHSHIENPPADETCPHTPGDIYQQTKSEGELLALRFNAEHRLPVSVARPAPIYGPGDLRLKLFRMIAEGWFVMLGSGEPFFHMVYVDDLVRGLKLLAERPEAVGEVYIFAGEEYLTLNGLVRLIADVLEVRPPRMRFPAWPVYLASGVVEKVCVPFGIEPPIYRRRVAFFTKSRAFSIAKARRELGYEPKVGLREGIIATAEWYRAEGLIPA